MKNYFALSLIVLVGCNTLTTTPPTSITLSEARTLSIETAADGSGTTVSARTLAYAGTLTVYAIARNGNGTFVSNPSATWTQSSTIGSLSSSSGTSTTLTISTASGSATLGASVTGVGSATSGTITVSFTPTNISGLALWLDANSSAMTALNYANNDAVAIWPDSSSTGNNALQLTAANQPLYKSNVVNSKAALQFDAVNDALNLETAIAMQPGTFVVVGKSNNAANAGPYLGNNAGAILFGYDGAGNARITDGVTPLTGVRPNPTASFEILTLSSASAGGSHELFANGSVSLITGTPNWGVNTYDRIGFDGAAAYFDGWIAEILYYSSALTSAQLGVLHSYLATKYGITLGL